jgi:hypothetical protein
MDKTKVKLFRCGEYELENKINTWLEEHKHNVEVVDIKLSMEKASERALIIYKVEE